MVEACPTLLDDAALAVLERRIDEWLAAIAAGWLPVEAIERGEGDERRWYVRMRGEDKDFTTVWLTLGQRTLRYETYVMPAPEENDAALYEHLLRRNERLVGAHFSIGIEDAVFLRGELPVDALSEAELDRVIGTLYATVEQCFQALLRIGFAEPFQLISSSPERPGSSRRFPTSPSRDDPDLSMSATRSAKRNANLRCRTR